MMGESMTDSYSTESSILTPRDNDVNITTIFLVALFHVLLTLFHSFSCLAHVEKKLVRFISSRYLCCSESELFGPILGRMRE